MFRGKNCRALNAMARPIHGIFLVASMGLCGRVFAAEPCAEVLLCSLVQ